MIGVLGGMGPAATVDFMVKIIRLTPVTRDQEHLPLIVLSDPHVPDRVGPIMTGEGEAPLPAMVRGIRTLEAAGAGCIVIPCHTAHVWYDELQASTPLPVLSMVEAVLTEVGRRAAPGLPVGLLATAATLNADLYQSRLEARGHPSLMPGPLVMRERVLPAIALVKRDRAAEAAPLLEAAVADLVAQGAELVVLACTELPVALAALGAPQVACLDATEALARATIAWYRARGEPS
jgi:aspartate racemase